MKWLMMDVQQRSSGPFSGLNLEDEGCRWCSLCPAPAPYSQDGWCGSAGLYMCCIHAVTLGLLILVFFFFSDVMISMR